jgi:ADP-heptose:LPS heptosyltransferase
MDTVAKRVELAGRRALVRLFRFARPGRSPVTLPIDASGKRILMLRQDRIGDVLVSLPVVHALKSRYPTARIDALFGTNNATAAPADMSFGSRFIYRKRLFADLALVAALRRRRYDILIDFMDNVSTSSTLLVRLIGAQVAVGIDKENSYAYDVVVPRLPQGEYHIVDRLAELLRPFGIDPATLDLRLRYPLPVSAVEKAGVWFATHARAPMIGVNVSSSGESKYWPDENFSALINGLKRAMPAMQVVLFSAPAEQDRTRVVSLATGAHVYPPGSFDEFAAGVKRCAMLVTVDTSAVHLGAAFRVPTVGLFVHDRAELMPWVPYRIPHRTVETTEHSVRSITVQEVLAACVHLAAACGLDATTASEHS